MSSSGPLFFVLATASDCAGVYDLVYRHPDPFIRAATNEEVETWVASGAVWVVREASGTVVGACNIRIPEATPEHADPAEFGGIFLQPNYRIKGVSGALSTLALASYYWDNDPDSREPLPLIAHVHVDNTKPLKLLDRIGFVFQQVIEVPDGVPGFEHMPKDAQGKLRGNEFLLPPKRRIQIFREMADLLADARIESFSVKFETPLEMTPEGLRGYADLLERQG
jgi:RimJ/RimL family protein N-acetyltransferase